jgi:hypothetical protein
VPNSKDKKKGKVDQSFESKVPATAGNTQPIGAQPVVAIPLVPDNIVVDPNANKLLISYAFKNPVKDFNVLLTMRNPNKTDIRRYKVWATVLPKSIIANIHI